LFFLDSSSVRAVDLASGEVRTIAKNGLYGSRSFGLETRFGKPALWGDGFNLYFGFARRRYFQNHRRGRNPTIQPSGSRGRLLDNNIFSRPLTAGYARVQPDAGSTTPEGVAIFGFRSNGVLVSEAAVRHRL